MSDYTAEFGEPITNEAGSFRLRIEYDIDGFNPRENDDMLLGTFVADVHGYDLPQEGAYGREIAYALRHVAENGSDAMNGYVGFRVISRLLRSRGGATVVLPLYTSGDSRELRLSAGDADVTDESGIVGLIYDTAEARAEGWGDETPDVETVTRNLRAEVEQYNAWANGEMTGWIVESTTDEDPDAAVWEQGDACWGYYSVDEAREVGTPELQATADQALVELRARQAEARDDQAEIDELRLAEVGTR